jgi:hypothetical protein
MRTIGVRVLTIVLFSIFASTASPGWSKDIKLAGQWKRLHPEHKKFLEQLSEVFKKDNPVLAPRWNVRRFTAALADLNGDGVDELLVRPESGVVCGNSGDCTVSIYQNTKSGWAFVGWLLDTQSIVVVEDLWVNGWRTLSDGVEGRRPTSRWCWMNKTSAGPEDAWIYEDPLGMPSTPGMAGYFGTQLPRDADCPPDVVPAPNS